MFDGESEPMTPRAEKDPPFDDVVPTWPPVAATPVGPAYDVTVCEVKIDKDVRRASVADHHLRDGVHDRRRAEAR